MLDQALSPLKQDLTLNLPFKDQRESVKIISKCLVNRNFSRKCSSFKQKLKPEFLAEFDKIFMV